MSRADAWGLLAAGLLFQPGTGRASPSSPPPRPSAGAPRAQRPAAPHPAPALRPDSTPPPVAVDATFTVGGSELATISLAAFRARYGPAPISAASGLRYVCYRSPGGQYVVFDASTAGAGLQVTRRLAEVDWRFGEPEDPVRPPARCLSSRKIDEVLQALPLGRGSSAARLKQKFGPPRTATATQLSYAWWDRSTGAQGPQDRVRFLTAQLRGDHVVALQLYETITS